MKKILLLLAVLLSVLSASGQPRSRSQMHGDRHDYVQRDDRRKKDRPRKDRIKDDHLRDGRLKDAARRKDVRRRDDRRHMPPRDNMRRKDFRGDVNCVGDWQELWNGCHVRLIVGKVRICNYDGDMVLQGDEVVLLSTGCYLVRNGDLWHIHERNGDRTMIHGSEIICWPDEFYCVRLGDQWHVYDYKGDRLFNVWGHEVVRMDNGLFRCRRNDRYYYYDIHGDERN